MLYHLYEGLVEQMNSIREDIRAHEETCGANPTICQVRYAGLVTQYGSVEDAVKEAGVILYDCMPDLADLYTTVGKLAAYIYKIDRMRLSPTEVGDDPNKTDWRPTEKLKQITAEVAHREKAAATDTQTMQKITDAPKGDGGGKTLLGLTDGTKKPVKVAPATP